MKTLEIKENKKGEKVALTVSGETYGVWIQKANYNGRVRGGLSYSWRYIVQGTTIEEATKVFKRRTK